MDIWQNAISFYPIRGKVSPIMKEDTGWASAKILSRGRVTIPKKVRDYMKIQKNDRIEWVVRDDGGVNLIPIYAPEPRTPGRENDA